MKTFTKHILLLALMLFGVAGAAWADRAPQKFTGPVAKTDLVQGDTLAPGFSITGLSVSNNLGFDGNRYKQGGVLGTGNMVTNGNTVTGYGGDNPVAIIISETILYTPVDESGQDGNAWVVTYTSGQYVFLSGIYIAPDPTVPALDELTGNWNFLMPGANKVVKAVLYDSVLVGANVAVQCSTGCSNIAYGYRNMGGDSILYFENSPILTLTANAPEGKAFDGWTDGNTDNPRTVTLDGDTAFLPIFYTPRTLTLNQAAGGTLTLDGVTTRDSVLYNIEINSQPQNITAYPYQKVIDYTDEVTNVYGGNADVSVAKTGQKQVTVTVNRGFSGTVTIDLTLSDGEDLHSGIIDVYGTSAGSIQLVELPAGVIARNANGSYQVKSGAELTLTATPDSAHYLANIGNEAVISNSAYNYSFTMPDEDTELAATFADKPTLTLTQTDGGTLEAIGSGDATIWNSETWNGWTNSEKEHTVGDITLQTTGFASDYNGNLDIFVSVYDDNKTVTFSTTGDNFTRIELTMTSGATFGNYGQPNILPADGWTVTEGDNVAVWEGNAASITMSSCSTAVSQIAFYRGTGTANVTPVANSNTYYIDYGTPVTVKATPDAQHYLVSFSDDDPATERNSNIAVEKT